MKKIYTEKSNCVDCGKPIREYAKSNRERVIKSWLAICMSCFKKYRNL